MMLTMYWQVAVSTVLCTADHVDPTGIARHITNLKAQSGTEHVLVHTQKKNTVIAYFVMSISTVTGDVVGRWPTNPQAMGTLGVTRVGPSRKKQARNRGRECWQVADCTLQNSRFRRFDLFALLTLLSLC